ncbi:hypothetical protein UVI_02003270 [Ustilaginoidea virens]|uniref:AAA+ ATPase domain-containing protein n=1 Tax=Ustilaginoidea virens TaxID=1159556 RepID=A0A1B5L0X2_USTVR|nr:hypothetical protein UVI_02003270 [Ustilaginoidea virens]
MSHVRGDGPGVSSSPNQQPELETCRKSKGQATAVAASESVLTTVLDCLDIDALRSCSRQNDDRDAPVPPELRIPGKHFETGPKLQHRIRPQLTVTSPLALAGEEDFGQDELAGPAPAAAHPSVSRHYLSLAKQLSAYDRSTCEGLAWNQKYAPVSSGEVMQKRSDVLHIKDWLEAMKVQSVGTGCGDGAGDRGRSSSDEVPKRKKRKKSKLDDFIVDTDDEGSEFEDVSGEDGEDADFWQSRKSVVRSGSARFKEPARLRNTIVISGPHGCGKTATVYAVARELGFEIFEINSSSRRSGKDVVEKVGDMTRNHLVQQHRARQLHGDGETNKPKGKEPTSGKQGFMTAFLKNNAATKRTKPARQLKKTTTSPPPPPPKAQKQSLILIEEADILYEEDKQFWATLMGMMNQSRRPFIITCNDESLIPLQSLHLHGIFRFLEAPLPSAVDLCLLVAANEGHVLQRRAVESLYRSRHHDLRATISELNFWCQIGVGDRRGGFDWFYSRWPRGCDVDERGDVVRVVSEDTYQRGMGWTGRDAVMAESNRHDREVEALQQAWNFWQVDMGDWSRSDGMASLAQDLETTASTCDARLAALGALDKFYRTQSDADLCAGGSLATQLQEQTDPTLPDLALGARDDFIVGRTLLNADEPCRHGSCGNAVSAAIKSHARAQLHDDLQSWLPSAPDDGRAAVLGPVDEPAAVHELDASFGSSAKRVTRTDVAHAFDAIAAAPKAQPTSHLDPSVFDRTMQLIVVDVAPWVRSIVAFEQHLMQQRLRRSGSLLGQGIQGAEAEAAAAAAAARKRMRSTRSAYSALEGSERRSTRRERYFGDALTTGLVMRTGGDSWQDAAAAEAAHAERAAETGRDLKGTMDRCETF